MDRGRGKFNFIALLRQRECCVLLLCYARHLHNLIGNISECLRPAIRWQNASANGKVGRVCIVLDGAILRENGP